MGMDAIVTIWAGCTDKELRGMELPPEVQSIFDDDDEVDVGAFDCPAGVKPHWGKQFTVQGIRQGDEYAGLGVVLLWHDWDYGAKEIDPQSIANAFAALAPVVRKKFDEWGIGAPVRLLLQTDFR